MRFRVLTLLQCPVELTHACLRVFTCVCCGVWCVVCVWCVMCVCVQCPFEMTKVRMQVTLPGDAGQVPKGLIPAFTALYANRKDTKFPFGSLYPLWGRQGVCPRLPVSLRPAFVAN